jgi:hypothetical protein
LGKECVKNSAINWMAVQWTYYNLVVYFISYIIMPAGGNQFVQAGGKGGDVAAAVPKHRNPGPPFSFYEGDREGIQ